MESIRGANWGKDESLLLWDSWMKRHANKARPYTFEANAAGSRVILTSDPENIKAVLATQFDDYGKGKDFNKEWHAFLGDSESIVVHVRSSSSSQQVSSAPIISSGTIPDS